MSTARPVRLPLVEPRPVAQPGSLAAAALQPGGPLSLGPPLQSSRVTMWRGELRDPVAFGVSGPKAKQRLEAVLAGKGWVVSTGQAPGLFLGPLYVIYKILTAISLADHIEISFDIPTLPLFWIASDDHDWEEAATTLIMDGQHPADIRKLFLELPPGLEGRAVGPLALPDSIAELAGELSRSLAGEYRGDYWRQCLADLWKPGVRFSEAFAETLRMALGDRGFAWLDAASPPVKAASTGFFASLLQDPALALQACRTGAEVVTAAGFEPAINILPDTLPLFFDGGSGRRRVVAPEAGPMLDRLHQNPAAFSPNVETRPVLESHLLSVRATVLGPGEAAYWTQLPPLFDALGVPRPGILPRASFALVEPRVRRWLERTETSVEALAAGPEQQEGRLIAEGRPTALNNEIAALRDETRRRWQAIEELGRESAPGSASAARKAGKRVEGALTDYERQVDREVRQRLGTRLGQLRAAAAQLFPGRRPQERVLGPIPFLARYGPELLDALARATDRYVDDHMTAQCPDAGETG